MKHIYLNWLKIRFDNDYLLSDRNYAISGLWINSICWHIVSTRAASADHYYTQNYGVCELDTTLLFEIHSSLFLLSASCLTKYLQILWKDFPILSQKPHHLEFYNFQPPSSKPLPQWPTDISFPKLNKNVDPEVFDLPQTFAADKVLGKSSCFSLITYQLISALSQKWKP